MRIKSELKDKVFVAFFVSCILAEVEPVFQKEVWASTDGRSGVRVKVVGICDADGHVYKMEDIEFISE